MNHRSITLMFGLVIGLSIQFLLVPPALATLKFYYDPATGNVSFDTSETRSGGLYNYGFQLNDYKNNNPLPWEFRTENLVRLSTSTLYFADPWRIADTTLSNPWRGLYTIGDVMPVGLSEEIWTNSFIHDGWDTDRFIYQYSDMIGGGPSPPAEFIYGPPEGEFQNKWDIVDPDTLTWATTAKLVYRAWSGEVLIDTTGDAGGYTSSFFFNSHDAFVPSNYASEIDSISIVTTNNIGLLADAVEPGKYSIGRILPPGLTLEEFESMFTNASFLGRAGFNGGSFDIESYGIPMLLQYVAVPEPATSWLLAIGVIAWRSSRRKR